MRKQQDIFQGKPSWKELQPGDVIRVFPISIGTKEPLIVVVLSKVGIQAYEAHTENGSRVLDRNCW